MGIIFAGANILIGKFEETLFYSSMIRNIFYI